MRGSKPGERRGGRKKGTQNKATRDVKALAQKYTDEAFETILEVMRRGDSAAVRLSGAKEVIERGHGKIPQAHVGGDDDSKPIRVVAEIRRSIVDARDAQ